MSFKLILITIAFPLAEILVSPIVGLLGDRFGYDLGILTGLFSALILNVLLSVTNSFWSVLVSRCIKGISFAFLVSLGYARILEVYPSSTKYHYIVMAIAMSTATFSVINSTFAGFVIKCFNVSASFEVMIPFGVVLIIVVVLQLRLTGPLAIQDSENQPLRATSATCSNRAGSSTGPWSPKWLLTIEW